MFKNSKAAALVATALAVLAGAVAGCGSSGDSATTADTTETAVADTANAAFVTEVEAICVDVNRKFRAINDSSRGKEPHVILGQAATQLQDAGRQMAAVEPPADIASDYEEMVRLLGAQADALADRSRAMRAGDDRAARAAEERGNAANRDQDLIAQNIGLDACAASAPEERAPPTETPFGQAPPS